MGHGYLVLLSEASFHTMIVFPDDLEPTKIWWKVQSKPNVEADQYSLGVLGIPLVDIHVSATEDLVRIQKVILHIFKVQHTSKHHKQ